MYVLKLFIKESGIYGKSSKIIIEIILEIERINHIDLFLTIEINMIFDLQ